MARFLKPNIAFFLPLQSYFQQFTEVNFRSSTSDDMSLFQGKLGGQGREELEVAGGFCRRYERYGGEV